MKTIWTTVGAVALIGLLTLSTARAQEASPAPAAAPATTEAPAQAEPAEPDAKNFEVTIDGKDSEPRDGGRSHGLSITIDDDDERADLAGKVVDRVVDKLEDSLANLPADVRRDIDADDMKELQQALADIRSMKHAPHHGAHHGSDSDDVMGEMIGMVAVLLLFGGPVLIVAIVSFNNRRKRQMVHETIDRIISQGKDVPVELLDALDKGRNGKNLLSRGVFWLALGLGLGGWLYAVSGIEAASFGLIPGCIGLAQLLAWKLDKPAGVDATVS